MPRKFRVVRKTIPDIHSHDDALLGIVKIQMPEQLDDDGSCRIRQRDRERNLRIVRNSINTFGNWAQQVEAPAIILFPEFSVSEPAVDWLRSEMLTSRVSPNTLIVLGLEQLSTDQFRSRVAASNSREDFAGVNFGPNIDRVNTAVILVKDNASRVLCYYQAKCSRSDYESDRQFMSNVVYEFEFGTYNLIVSICSDFLLRDDGGTLVGSVMQEMDQLYPRPRDHRLDLVLLIQKNVSPLHPLFHDSITHLFYNRPHRVQTTDTIVCAVNSASTHAPGKFGRCNVSVMRRGRPPVDLKSHLGAERYAWCSLKDNEDLHYVRWRLRSPGAISFVLATDQRPWQLGNTESVPISRGGLHKIRESSLEECFPIPEVYEMEEALYDNFDSFLETIFQVDALKRHFGSVSEYERLLSSLFVRRPIKLVKLLLSFQKASANCDHWDIESLKGTFRYFLLTVRFLSERYNDLAIPDDYFSAEGRTLGVIDCDERPFIDILDELMNRLILPSNVEVLLLQRISKLISWDGSPIRLEELNSLISVSKPASLTVPGSVARAPSPHIADVGSVAGHLNQRCLTAADVRSVLNESLRFA
jgi:hypothetical protein